MPKPHRARRKADGDRTDRPHAPTDRERREPTPEIEPAGDAAGSDRDDAPRRNPYAELRRRDQRSIEMAYAHGGAPRQSAYRSWDDSARQLVRRLGASHPELSGALQARRLADAYRSASQLLGEYAEETQTRAWLEELRATVGAMLLYLHADATHIGQALALDDKQRDDRELPWKAA